MKKELTTQHLKNLKELLKAKKIKPYDLAHASFRKNNAHAIISKVDKYEIQLFKILIKNAEKHINITKHQTMERNINIVKSLYLDNPDKKKTLQEVAHEDDINNQLMFNNLL